MTLELGTRGDPCPKCLKKRLRRVMHAHAYGYYTSAAECGGCGSFFDRFTGKEITAREARQA